MKTGLGISVNEQPAKELHKPVIKKFKKRKVYARFKDNIQATDLTEMGSLYSKNKNVNIYPPAMRRRKDVSIRSHIDWDIADHSETSSLHCNW